MASVKDELRFYPINIMHANRRSFSYLDMGEGEVVVLLHGIGSGAASWLHQFKGLGKDYRLIAWDAPGYGTSSCLRNKEPKPDHYAAALHELLKGLRIKKATIVGHSLGALVAASFARQWPDLVHKLILVNPALGYGRRSKSEKQAVIQQRVDQIDNLGADGIAASRAANLLSANASEDALALVQHNMRRLSGPGYKQAACMLAQGDLLEDAGHYRGPVMVICGTKDTITPPEGAKLVAATYTNGIYFDLKGAGHASYIEKHYEFNKLIKYFV
ncbi:MAG: alpha/beta hydrolase [Alphaproteobacteria bacterium]|nr:MAG: alpha/beta hydrolase [Alphaproteobacteria bacterium]